MKRIALAAAALLLSASTAFSQQGAASSKVLPMFGQQAKTDAQQRADERFLTSCDKSFETRTEASNFFMDRGWEFLNEGQTDTAVYRFNLAWLLNPDNYNTYWGFGLVEHSKGKPKEAIAMYDRALKYQPKNSLLLSDLGASQLHLYLQDKKKKTLKVAEQTLLRALENDKENAFAMSNLAQVYFYDKKYAQAWDYLHRGRERNMMSLDYDFLSNLMVEMPDPKGVFRNEEQAAQ